MAYFTPMFTALVLIALGLFGLLALISEIRSTQYDQSDQAVMRQIEVENHLRIMKATYFSRL